jgi:predicted nucleotidyltransferase
MPVARLLAGKRDEILRIARTHRATNVRVFGSAARDELRAESDVDLLVTFDGASLLDHVALIQDLEDLLGRKVDVAADTALHWSIRDAILQDAVPL